jgi:hypothetical protein
VPRSLLWLALSIELLLNEGCETAPVEGLAVLAAEGLFDIPVVGFVTLPVVGREDVPADGLLSTDFQSFPCLDCQPLFVF